MVPRPLSRSLPILCAVLLPAVLAACAARGDRGQPATSAAPTTGERSAATTAPALLHIVLIRLKDPLDTAALARDNLAMAAQVPSIASVFAGLHHETGRETVVRDYDLCFTLGFDTPAAYEAYLVHPAHLALIEQWRTRIEWLRIYDARDVRP